MLHLLTFMNSVIGVHTCDIILDANREIWALKSYFVF